MVAMGNGMLGMWTDSHANLTHTYHTPLSLSLSPPLSLLDESLVLLKTSSVSPASLAIPIMAIGRRTRSTFSVANDFVKTGRPSPHSVSL